jgi:hypothetical protein
VSGTKRAPNEPKRVYGSAKTSDDLAPGTESAAIKQFGAKGKDAATTATPYPGGAENAAARKADGADRKGQGETEQPASRSEPEQGFGRRTDTKGGDRALERSSGTRNLPGGGDAVQRSPRPRTGDTIPQGDVPEESPKKRAPAGGENMGEGMGSIGNPPGNPQ